jgi:hypothetical protein
MTENHSKEDKGGRTLSLFIDFGETALRDAATLVLEALRSRHNDCANVNMVDDAV